MSYTPNIPIIDDQSLTGVKVSSMGELVIDRHTRLVGTAFVGATLDTNFWTSTPANGGTNTIANAQLTCQTNTTANGSAILQSVRTARYVSSISNKYRGQVRLSLGAGGGPGATDNVRRWGVFNGVDGAYFFLSGTTFGVATRKTNSETPVNSGSFNGTGGTTYAIDANNHTYEIIYTNSKVRFYIDDVLIHTVTASTTSWCDTLALPSRCDNTNSNNSVTSCIMEVRSMSIVRLGQYMTSPISKIISTNTTTVLKYGGGTLHKIIISVVGTVNNTTTIYDNTAGSGTIIGILDSTNANLLDVIYELDFYIGLTIVTASNTAPTITVIYE